MRKLMMIAAAATLANMSGATAADLGHGHDDIYAAAPVFSWTGFYVGGSGGYGWGTEHQQVVGIPVAHMDFEPEGAIAGGQVGINWQPRPGIVLGAEGSLMWSGIGDDTKYDPGFGLHENISDLRALGDISGRLGFTIDRTMIFGKAGIAWGKFDHSYNMMGMHYTSPTDDRVGWLVGGGVEFALSQNWSAKVEYNYVDFGTGVFVLNGDDVQATSYTDTVSLVKGGINYKFGAPQAGSLK